VAVAKNAAQPRLSRKTKVPLFGSVEPLVPLGAFQGASGETMDS